LEVIISDTVVPRSMSRAGLRDADDRHCRRSTGRPPCR
jgi:hypothetical protein